MKRYFKYRWNETRGDKFDSWGFLTWYSEFDEELFPIRQIEVYDNGIVLKYSNEHLDDEFGMLGDQSLSGNLEDSLEISNKEFENIWFLHKGFNS